MSKKKIVWLMVLVISLGVVTGCKQMIQSKQAEDRVATMLECWQRSEGRPTRDEQTATCMFYEGVIVINDRPTLEKAVDKYAEFKTAKNLYRKIETWEVLSATADGDAFLVEVKIDGEYYTMRVVEDEPITWAD